MGKLNLNMRDAEAPITEQELKEFERRAKDYTDGYIRAADVRRLVRDNRRLRNLLMDLVEK